MASWNRMLEALFERRRAMSDGHRRGVALLLSLVVAFALWFSFSLREQYSVVVEMPVEIGRLPEGRALATRPPSRIRVTVQGVGVELMRLRQNPPVLLLHATGEQIDVVAAVLESPRLPAGLSVQSVSPSTITLNLEPEVTRTIPIRLDASIQPAPAFDLTTAPRLRPDTVVVTGARSLVLPLDHLRTERVAYEGLRQPFTAQVALHDTFPGLLRTSVQMVEVEIPVAPFTEATRELDVRVEGAPPGAASVVLVPGRVRVVFRVPVARYEDALRSPELFAYVPYATVVDDTTGAVRPVLNLPADIPIRDARSEPRWLRYRVRIE